MRARSATGVTVMAVALAASVGSVGIGSASARSLRYRRCPDVQRPISANRVAEIYEAEEREVGVRVYGCDFATGRVSRLGSPVYGGSGVEGGVQHEALDGAIAVFGSFSTSTALEQQRWYVVVCDLRSGRVLHHLPTGTPLNAKPGSSGVGPAVAMVVTARGSVAWIAEDIERTQSGRTPGNEDVYYDVYASDASGTRLLDSGFEVDPSSLALAGQTVYWTRGAQPYSAQLH